MDEIDIFAVPPSHSGILDRRITTKSVTVYGLGHLGSWVVLALSKLGVLDINVNDFDTVEPRNISGSVYTYRNVSHLKSDALSTIVMESKDGVDNLTRSAIMPGNNIRSLGYIVGENSTFGFNFQPFSDFYILGTDNVESRKRIAETILKQWRMCAHSTFFKNVRPIFIDIRSNGATIAVLTVPIRDVEMSNLYLAELDRLRGEGGAVRCNEANIIQASLRVASIVAQIVASFTMGVERFYYWEGSVKDLTTEPYRILAEQQLAK